VIKENKVVTDLSTIYRYNPEEDSWTLLDSRMKEGKRSVIAVLIDRDVLKAE
jgi:N-acetylneuraminic acid mutarotase